MKEIVFYKLPNGKEPVKEWLEKLDIKTRIKIIKRLERIYDNNFGDFKQIYSNLYELRFTFGKGYRIYYTVCGQKIVLLLNAGDKTRQSKDISTAKKYLKDINYDKSE